MVAAEQHWKETEYGESVVDFARFHVRCFWRLLALLFWMSFSGAVVAQNDKGRIVAGPLSDFLTEQQISELQLERETLATVYTAGRPFFRLPRDVNPRAELVAFFETHCARLGTQSIYVTWVENYREFNSRFDVTVDSDSSGGCVISRMEETAVSRDEVEKYRTFTNRQFTYLSGLQGKDATKNRRFEAQLRRNTLGGLVGVIVFEERKIRTIFGQLAQDLTGGGKNRGWDGKLIFYYNFVLGVANFRER